MSEPVVHWAPRRDGAAACGARFATTVGPTAKHATCEDCLRLAKLAAEAMAHG